MQNMASEIEGNEAQDVQFAVGENAAAEIEGNEAQDIQFAVGGNKERMNWREAFLGGARYWFCGE